MLFRSVVKRNWFSIYYFDFRRQPGIIFLILFFIFLFNPNRKKILTEGYCFSLLVSLAIIYFGYSMILVHSRYTWVCTLAMLLLSAWILEEFRFKKRSIQSGFRKVVILLIAVLTIKRPVKELLFTRDSQISWVVFSDALLHPARTLEANYSEDKYFFERKNEIKNFIKPGSSLALTGTTDGNRDSYTRGSLLAMACGAKFLGIEPNDAVIAQQTIQADYLMIFSPVSQVPDSVHWQMEFDDNKMPIRIFARKK